MFSHLNVKSEYTILNSIAKIDGLIAKAKRNNMKHLALTDINNMHIIYTFQNKCIKNDIHPILGLSLVVHRGSDFHLLTYLAKSIDGYHNLVDLSTLANMGEKDFPYVEFSALAGKTKDVFCMTGGLSGELLTLVASNRLEEADNLLDELTALYGTNVIIELSNHNTSAEEIFLKSSWLKEKIQQGYMYVATNDIYYLQKEHALHRSIGLSLNPNPAGIDIYSNYVDYNSEFYFKTENEMEKAFHSYLNDFPLALSNTEVIANQCQAEVPVEKALPQFPLPEGYTSESFLEKRIWEGFAERFPTSDAFDKRFTEQEYRDRLTYEFETIKKMGFVDYFLITEDFINWAKDKDVYKHPERYFPGYDLTKISDMCKNKDFVIEVGPGRGSAAGSLLSYCLKITNLDPMRYDLLFERFLNIERVSMPDIDIDFSNLDREKVVEYVQNKYGYEKVSQIATFQTLGLKSIIKKVAKSYGIPYFKADEMTKQIPNTIIVEKENSDGIIEKIEKKPELLSEIESIDYFARQINLDDDIKAVFRNGKILEGLPASTGKHAAGVIIGRRPLQDYLPLMEVDGVLVTQFEKTDSEAIGLLKMDFLGLQTLDIEQKTKDLVLENYGIQLDLDHISIEDKDTFHLFQEGNTGRVFQFEGAGMKNLLKKMKPTSLEHLNACCALYRPGPMEFIPNYLEGRQNPENILYPHKAFKDVTEETYGILVYQEQIMALVQKMAGFTLGQSDVLRRGIGKKIQKYLTEGRQQFVEGSKKQLNVDEETSNEIYDTIVKFANYGFNKSHSCAYAYVSYQTAYLKVHYPEAFMAANLTIAAQDKDKVAAILSECNKMGIKVLPPDIDKSEDRFTIEKQENGSYAIRYGFSAITDTGDDVAKEMMNIRNVSSLQEFIEKIPSKMLRTNQITSLIEAGAFDKFGTRKTMCNEVKKIIEFVKYNNSIVQEGYETFLTSLPVKKEFKGYEYPSSEKLEKEKRAIHVALSGHVLDGLRPLYPDAEYLSEIIYDEDNYSNKFVHTIGIVKNIHRINTKKGLPMAFITIEDEFASIEGVIFPKDYAKIQEKILEFEDSPVEINGKFQVEVLDDMSKKISLIISTVKPLIRENCLYIHKNTISQTVIDELASPQNNGISEVILIDDTNIQAISVNVLPFKIKINENVINILKKNKVEFLRYENKS